MFSKGYINSNPVKFSYFKIIVAIALIVGLCAYISPRAILVAIEGMDLGFLSVAIALMPVFILCRTLKWYFLVRQINSDIRFVDILPSYLRGMLAGLFTPLRLGEAIRTIGTGQTSTQCALFVVEKMIELLSLLVLCSIVLIKLQPEMAWVMIPACLIILFSRRILIYIAIRSVRLLSRLFHKPSSVDLPQVEDDIRRLRLSGCAILSVCVFLIF
ncbi:flippase-like domain-containing protein, partial [bacterium]|nr:flippase-like domain-containing protein [bacterium]